MAKGYVWYSFGSDESGPLLAHALGFDSGKKTPNVEEFDVVVGWGCKPGNTYSAEKFAKAVAGGKLRLINDVRAIDANRNKLTTIENLQKAVPVPGFIRWSPGSNSATVAQAIKEGKLAFPILGFRKDHKGAPIFFYTLEDFDRAPAGLDYLRSFSVGTEYRIHVFRNSILFAQKKVLAKDPEAAIVEDLKNRYMRAAAKAKENDQGVVFPPTKTLIKVLQEIAPDILCSTSQIQRSVNRGWELVDIAPAKLPAVAKDIAIRALDSVGLDCGAVNIVHDTAGKAEPVVTSIASAPGINNAQMALYAQAIIKFTKGGPVKKIAAAAPAAYVGVKKPSIELVAQINEAITKLDEQKAQSLLAFLNN